MSEYFEIAYAAAARRLCLFTGTGFSKAVTNNKAPSWQDLLEEVCDRHLTDGGLKALLFPKKGSNPLLLEESAQVIELELSHLGKSIHQEISEIIKLYEPSTDLGKIEEFFTKRSFRVITTNYDKLSEEIAGDDVQSLSPGQPIPRSGSRVKVFHVHGSVDLPNRMVVTSNDYFNFMNAETYFSRKLSTVLHENTVVILGYSLGDTNLKAILNEYGGFLKSHSVSSSIFFVSRSPVEQSIADYYAKCYGIRVIDETEVEEFFRQVERHYDRAESILDKSIKSVQVVLRGEKGFKDSFLKLDTSFYEITAAISALGVSLDEPSVVRLFGKIIGKKREFCAEKGAWEQYEHLAGWLAHIGTILEIPGRSIENQYLESVQYSMEHMSKRLLLGYSWHAYKRWDERWKNIISANRDIIRRHIVTNCQHQDALAIVSK